MSPDHTGIRQDRLSPAWEGACGSGSAWSGRASSPRSCTCTTCPNWPTASTSRPCATWTDWRELIAHPLDAVMVLTSGSHAPIAQAAAWAGRHVFVEKPMCFSAAEGRAMVAAAEAAGVVLMTGYPKRYDPAFARMREETAGLDGARLLRGTT